ncbi:MAG: tRNA pseudouridine(13) synthase TruD [Candidatus Aenigmarchaeota archaeon]|nr:tRNA pseudouridine(13) synthase TruD [Candidatus Aenigmarchaeota archaeon]
MLPYVTKTAGIGGWFNDPEDFVVHEHIAPKFLRKFRRTEKGIAHAGGSHRLFLLKKRNLTTAEALAQLCAALHVDQKQIGIAGRKDKHAITYQYVTIKNCTATEFKKDQLSLTFVADIDKKISIGDLIGNEFEITLHDVEHSERIQTLIKELQHYGMPNYFGPQRFGVQKNNHIIGKEILERNFSQAARLAGKSSLQQMQKEVVKFYIHAYQSYLFNQLLGTCIAQKNFSDDTIPILGYGLPLTGTVKKSYEQLLTQEGIMLSDFKINELRITAQGGLRKAFVPIEQLQVKTENTDISLKFFLPKGSYATIVLRELTKNEEKTTIF